MSYLSDFHATLNLTFRARDLEEARHIASLCKAAIEQYNQQPFKVDVEVDDIEEL